MDMGNKLTRRHVLTGAALAAAAGAAGEFGRGLSALASITVGPNGAAVPPGPAGGSGAFSSGSRMKGAWAFHLKLG